MAAAPNVQDPPQQQQVVSSASFAAHPQAKALGTMHRPALQMNLPAQDLDGKNLSERLKGADSGRITTTDCTDIVSCQ